MDYIIGQCFNKEFKAPLASKHDLSQVQFQRVENFD